MVSYRWSSATVPLSFMVVEILCIKDLYSPIENVLIPMFVYWEQNRVYNISALGI